MTKKTKPFIKLNFADSISIIFSIFLFALLLINHSFASAEVIKSLKICTSILIPSLFPLTVVSEIMTESGTVAKITYGISRLFSKILGVSKAATVPYFIGLCGGYTPSCKSAALLYRSGKISKGDFESIIAISSMPSLAFITGFVGIGIFNNSTIGWILWVITIISTLFLGIINKFFFSTDLDIHPLITNDKTSSIKLSQITVKAIVHAAYAMLIICACVVFFSVLISVLKICMDHFQITEQAKNIILGTLEITNGINACIDIENTYLRVLGCSFFIGWSGVCVHFQVISLCEDANISFKKYIIFKGLQGVICALLTWMFFGLKFHFI